MNRSIRFGAIAIAFAALVLGGQGSASAQSLNGADNTRETFKDWTVICGTTKENKTICGMEQILTKEDTKQRMFSIAIRPQADGTVQADMILPLGVDLQKGITMSLDGGDRTAPAPLKVCVQAGCVVTLQWKAENLEGFKVAKQLKVFTQPPNGKEVGLTVSLAGFAQALDRTTQLSAAAQ